jgi:hypothetical protein
MFRRQKPPKHILFIGEKNDTRDYIIELIKQETIDPKAKSPEYTFTTEEINFDREMRKPLLNRTDGAIFFVDTAKTKQLSEIKEFLWEYFVWNQASTNIPVLIASYNAERALALTPSEIIEAFSLIRLTDRLWNVKEIKENKPEDILACFAWLNDYIDILGVKPKEEKKGKKKK